MKLPLLLLVLFMVWLVSCKKVPCPSDKVLNLEMPSDEYKEPLISYSGFDTLLFKDELGKLYTFIGSGDLDSGYNSVSDFDDGNCSTKTTFHRKYYLYHFASGEFQNDIIYYVGYIGGVNSISPEFVISVRDYSYRAFSDLPPKGNSNYIDNLVIGNDTFNQVLKITEEFPRNGIYIYYSVKNGIIQINFGNGRTLTKVK